jgi:hypothetical protein
VNSKRPEHDCAKETEGDHHSQHIEFQRQTHGVTSELLRQWEANRNCGALQNENVAAVQQIVKCLILFGKDM